MAREDFTIEESDRIFEIHSRLNYEYKGLAFSNHKKLTLLNLSMDELPEDIRDSIEVLATVAEVLGLEDISQHTLILKNTELLLKEHRIHEMQFDIKLEAIKVKKILKDLQDQTIIIRRMGERTLGGKENLITQREKKAAVVAFLETKVKSYHEKVQNLDVTIAELGPQFDLKDITDCDEEIKSMDEQIRVLRSKLEVYSNLPPDMDLAREKLKEEKLKTEKRQEELANWIDNYVKTLT